MERCTASFPCLANIFVLAGLNEPCAVCAPHLDNIRDIEGTVPDGEGFYKLKNITPEQQREIEARVTERVHFREILRARNVTVEVDENGKPRAIVLGSSLMR